ncbi:Plant-specific transcription factor YABBY family protein [Euphorbia peplus]|nr:Plant-specific transcription factor YABBY family protein [Euphorbia peplus]
MSLDLLSERVCYVNCNFCKTILAVSVPCSNLMTMVTVRCGHCGNLLSVDMGASLQIFAPPPPPQQHQTQKLEMNTQNQNEDRDENEDHHVNKDYDGCSSNSKCSSFTSFDSPDTQSPRMPPIRPPEKRQRVPSAYNRFIKEEIQRIKASNPDITHREAFSTAAKNWAHFPHIQFGLKEKHGKFEQSFGGDTNLTPKTNGFYEIN